MKEFLPKEYGKKKEIEKKIKEVCYLLSTLKKFWDSCKWRRKNYNGLKLKFPEVSVIELVFQVKVQT